jgi:hypothetical protein
MTFAAPLFLAAGAGAALVVVALHFLARQRPRAMSFPTARFIPERVVRAPSRAVKPSDLLLLAMRAAALVLLGAAFARPAWQPSRKGTVRVVVVDRSRAVNSATEVRDSALALLRDGDRLVVFDSASREITSNAHDSLARLVVEPTAGSLSAALVSARRAAVGAAAGADSGELVLISPLAREEWDAATASIRALWPGRVRLVRVAMADAAAERAPVEIRGTSDDPLRTAGFGARRAAQPVRVVRGALAPGDSAWAANTGGVLVHWPARFDGRPADTIGAVVLASDVVVAPFARYGALRDSGARVLARWADGAAAATERAVGAAGCVREVAIPVPESGDLVLRESFRRVAAGLLAPCGGTRDTELLADHFATTLRGPGALASGAAFTVARDDVSTLVPWLLFAAMVLLFAEMALRQRAA